MEWDADLSSAEKLVIRPPFLASGIMGNIRDPRFPQEKGPRYRSWGNGNGTVTLAPDVEPSPTDTGASKASAGDTVVARD